MQQRPQFLLEAFAHAGHPVWFIDPRAPEPHTVDGVQIVQTLDSVPTDQVILYVHFAPLAPMFEQFVDPVIVYDILDDLSIYDVDEVDVPEHLRVRFHHPTVLERADVVIVSNEILAERHRPERPDLIHVPNGVDVSRFGIPADRPPDVPFGGPVIGYHGMISHWFDFDLLTGVAQRRPEWRFVLVGPTDPRVEDRAAELERVCGNVRRLGERPSSLMPGYAQAFDVGSIWFILDEMTMGVTPLKMYESLAAGVPCVSTSLPACVAQQGVATADEPDDFVRAIEDALAGEAGREHALRRIAADADWSNALQPALDRLASLGLERIR